MKKLTICAVLVLILFTATFAYAGIFGSIKDAISGKILEIVVAGIFAVLSVFLGAKVMKFRKAVTELTDIGVAIYGSVQPESPGGAKITQTELEKILKESGEAGIAIITAFKTRNNM